jgi:hypothetical protein
MSNTTLIFRESEYIETHGGIGIQVSTGANFVGEFSRSTQGYEFFEPIPESFIRALDDFNHGRFVSVETAHNDPPPNA